MKHKFVEIRDGGTCIAAVAIQAGNCWADDNTAMRFFEHAGFDSEGNSIILLRLAHPCTAEYDAFAWLRDNPHTRGTRTMFEAHRWIKANWAAIQDGQVVDVRVILGEAAEPARPEVGLV